MLFQAKDNQNIDPAMHNVYIIVLCHTALFVSYMKNNIGSWWPKNSLVAANEIEMLFNPISGGLKSHISNMW